MSAFDPIRSLVGRSCLALDDGDFDGYLDLCAPEFAYSIVVWSPELGKEMVWLDHDRDGLSGLFETLPEHLQRSGSLSRHVSVYTVEEQADAGSYYVVSSVVVHHTDLDGRTQTLAVGRYLDTIVCVDGDYRLSAREVALETRDLGIGLHVPL
jgi:methanesulfonate monooxygenase subunit beta